MDDETRIAQAARKGKNMLGPVERQRCDRHPRRWVTFRWVWSVDGDISGADVVSVRSCAECSNEDE